MLVDSHGVREQHQSSHLSSAGGDGNQRVQQDKVDSSHCPITADPVLPVVLVHYDLYQVYL